MRHCSFLGNFDKIQFLAPEGHHDCIQCVVVAHDVQNRDEGAITDGGSVM